MAIKKHFESFKHKLYWEGGLSFANLTLINGAFLVGYSLLLGASELMVGILAAIPLFANVLQLFSAFILEATGSRKRTSIASLVLGRLMWLPVIALAFGAFNASPLILFTVVLVISSLLVALGNLAVLSWIKDIVPMRKLPRFWGRRNIYASIFGIVAYLVGSVFIDYFPGAEAYGYVFLAAMVIGLAGVAIVLRLPEKKRKVRAISLDRWKQNISVPLGDRGFRPLLHFGSYFGFVIGFLSPFYVVFMLEELGMGFTGISILYVIDLLARVAGLEFWSRVMEKWGSRPALILGITIMVLNPLLFVVLVNTNTFLNYFLIALVWIVTAIAYGGVDIGTYRAVFKSAPRQYDAYYLSVFSSFVGVMSAIGPIAGGLVATLIAGSLPSWFSSVRALFVIAFVMRAFAIVLATRIHEPRARGVDDVLARMKTIRFISFFPYVYNVAYLASRLVLFPTKQLFFIQRKATGRMQKDVLKSLETIGKIALALDNFNERNASYYKNRFEQLRKMLAKNVNELQYQKGTWYQEIPQQTLETVARFEEVIGQPSAAGKSEKLHEQIERLRKKLEGAWERNIK